MRNPNQTITFLKTSYKMNLIKIHNISVKYISVLWILNEIQGKSSFDPVECDT
jgi:hypothetical protein